jgi:hypothetical protein
VDRPAISVVPPQAPLAAAPAAARDGAPTTPLYIVCSVHRGVGKTLLARLLVESHLIRGRPVAAFDLADEEPQLTDYLPRCTTMADISDTLGQMALFDRLVADDRTAKVVDLSHRSFKDFFLVAKKIGLFAEARRAAVEPLILFVIDPSSKSSEGYAILRRSFTDASLMPVRNRIAATGIAARYAPPSARPSSGAFEIAMLDASLRALVDRPPFSFGEFWQTAPRHLPAGMVDELRTWMEQVFRQLREVERRLAGEEMLSSLD